MHKNATKCNKTLSKWCKNKHGASKIIDTFETYQSIGGNIDLDLLSLFHQRYARIMGGIERWASFPRSTLVGERKRGKPSFQPLGKKGGLL
jgi:hypothetical protein